MSAGLRELTQKHGPLWVNSPIFRIRCFFVSHRKTGSWPLRQLIYGSGSHNFPHLGVRPKSPPGTPLPGRTDEF